MSNTRKTCRDCIFFEHLKKVNSTVDEGQCKRFPPSMRYEGKYKVGQADQWPLTLSIELACGEFKASHATDSELRLALDELEACKEASGFVPGDTPLPVWIAQLHSRLVEREAWWSRRYESRMFEIKCLKMQLKSVKA